jgi:hypothetical protein
LIRSLPYEHWGFLALAVVPLALACHPAIEAPGVPLYPNGETTRLPRDQIALVAGPIAKIDGQEVVDQGGRYELLPGCHVVELDRRMTANGNSLTGGAYWTGQFPSTVYAIRMKAGARYDIRRDLYADGLGGMGRIALSAREEEANGTGSDIVPANSEEDLKACKQ